MGGAAFCNFLVWSLGRRSPPFFPCLGPGVRDFHVVYIAVQNESMFLVYFFCLHGDDEIGGFRKGGEARWAPAVLPFGSVVRLFSLPLSSSPFIGQGRKTHQSCTIVDFSIHIYSSKKMGKQTERERESGDAGKMPFLYIDTRIEKKRRKHLRRRKRRADRPNRTPRRWTDIYAEGERKRDFGERGGLVGIDQRRRPAGMNLSSTKQAEARFSSHLLFVCLFCFCC